MSFSARLEAYGPFDADLSGYMEYPGARCKDIPDGTMVVTTLLDLSSPGPAGQLFDCLGIDRHEFGKLVLSADDMKRSLVWQGGDWDCFLGKFDSEDSEKFLNALRMMMDRGFVFFARPSF